MISIYSNISSLDAEINLNNTQMNVSKNMAHLSSGLRINDASDDAAGLGIATLFTAQTQGYEQAERNANDGISLLQTGDGALAQIQTILTRMRELAVQSANGTYDTSDRANIVVEVQQLQSEIDRISGSTAFGGVSMLNAATTVTLQVGINNTSSDQISLDLNATTSAALGVNSAAVQVDTQSDAQAALAKIDSAIQTVSSQRANIGALENRVQVASTNDATFDLNLSAATSQIQDVDVASESADLARNQVLAQAGVAVLAQANQEPSYALKLLGS